MQRSTTILKPTLNADHYFRFRHRFRHVVNANISHNSHTKIFIQAFIIAVTFVREAKFAFIYLKKMNYIDKYRSNFHQPTRKIFKHLRENFAFYFDESLHQFRSTKSRS